MIKTFVILLFGMVCLTSCGTEVKDHQTLYLENEISRLNGRIDSLVGVLSLQQEAARAPETPKKGAKKKKSSNLSRSTVASGYASYSASSGSRKTSSSYSGQCQATTKKGYQCSRKARSGGYCWQHGG